MADNTDLTVRFGAETSELRAQLAIAQATLKSTTAEMKNLAAQMVATGQAGNSSLNSALTSIAQDASKAKETVSTLSASLKDTSGSAHGAGAGVSFYARELHAMVDEGLSGRFRQLQGTATNVLFTLAQANPVAAGAAVGITALGLAIGYLVVQTIEARNAIMAVRLGLTISGVTDLAKDDIEGLIDTIQQLPGSSYEMAREVVNSFAQMQNTSAPVIKALTNLLGDYAAITGQKIPEAAKELKKAFEDPVAGAQKLQEIFGAMTPAEIAMLDAAVRTGHAAQAQAAMLAVLNTRLEAGRTVMHENAQEAANLAQQMALAATSDGTFVSAQQEVGNATVNATEKLKLQQAAILSQIEAAKSAAATPDQTIKVGIAVGDKEGSPQDSYGKATVAIRQMSAALDEMRAKVGSNPTGEQEAAIARLAFQLENAKNKAEGLKNSMQGGSDLAIRQAQTQIASNLGAMSQSEDAKIQIQGLQDTLRTAQMTDETRKQLEVDLSAKIKSLRDIEAADAKAHADLQAAEAKRGSDQEYAARAAGIRAGMAAQHEGDANYTTSQTALVNLTREQANEKMAIARDAEASKYEAQLKGVESSMANVKEEAKAKEISYQQELTQLLALQAQKESIERTHLTFVASTYTDDVAAYASAQRKLAELTATSAQERATIFRQTDRQIQEDITKTFEKMGSTVSSSLMAIIEGTGTWYKLMQNVARQIVSDFLSAGIKMAADWAAVQAKNLAVGIMTQTGLTGATATGEAARASLAVSGAAAAGAAQAAAAGKAIATDAAQTFGGIFAFLSPFMGPAAAGPAAGGEGAVLAAAGSINGSYAVGSWQLQNDQLAQVHAGEMIVPAAQTPWAQSLMANAAGGGGSNGGGATHNHNWNISALDGESVKRTLMANGGALMKAIGNAVKGGHHLGVAGLQGR